MNKYVKALAGLVLFSATVHLSILLVYAFIWRNIDIWNYFNILELDFIWPKIAGGLLFNTLSGICAAIIYMAFLIYQIEKERNRPKS